MFAPDRWPPWVAQAFWTAATIVAALLAGLVVRLIGGRLLRLAARTSKEWDDILVREIGRRLPLWSVLIGLHLSQARWPLTDKAHELAAGGLGAIGIASVTFAIAAIFTRLVVAYGSRAAMPVPGLTLNLIRIVVTVLGGLVIIKSFNYDISPMLTVLGVSGLTVALALQEPLSNLFAGVFVSLAGQIRIGDYVRLDSGAEGYVVDFNWRSSRIRQPSDNLIEVPNSKLAQAVVTNFSLPSPELGMGLDLVIDTANDLAMVERVATDAAATVIRDIRGAVISSAPSVRFMGITEVGVRLTIGLRVQSFADQVAVRHELLKRIHQQFQAHGVIWAEARTNATAAPPPS